MTDIKQGQGHNTLHFKLYINRIFIVILNINSAKIEI